MEPWLLHAPSDRRRRWLNGLAQVFSVLALLAVADLLVLEWWLKPIASEHNITWRHFDRPVAILPGRPVFLGWHPVFLWLGMGFFALCGIFQRHWQLAVSGMLAFATGGEDILYYLFQLKLPSSQLPWLNDNPAIAWTRWVFGGPHVKDEGLWLAATLGAVVAGLLLRPGAIPKIKVQDEPDIRPGGTS